MSAERDQLLVRRAYDLGRLDAVQVLRAALGGCAATYDAESVHRVLEEISRPHPVGWTPRDPSAPSFKQEDMARLSYGVKLDTDDLEQLDKAARADVDQLLTPDGHWRPPLR